MRRRTLNSWTSLCLLAAAALQAQEAPIPRSDELPSSPYAIKKTWVIGGTGDWDYLTVDPAARQLFIAHGPDVQVVDIETGAVVGAVTGLGQAHAVVLDDPGPYGYATDGVMNPAYGRSIRNAELQQGPGFTGGVKIFDRRTFRDVANILTRPSLRELILEPQTGLLFALGTDLSTLPPPPPRPGRSHATSVSRTINLTPPKSAPSQNSPCTSNSSGSMPESVISIIDPQKQREVLDIRVCGLLGSARPDGDGGVYITFTSRNMAARVDLEAIVQMLAAETSSEPRRAEIRGTQYVYDNVTEWDWRTQTSPKAGYGEVLPQLRTIGLSDCSEPHGLAIDSRQNRLFVGCNDMKLVVLDSNSGASIASLIIGPGTDSIAYDPNRGLIFTANGGGYGSLTVIHRSLNDTYSVVQNLPTETKARTLALDPATGDVFLVTAVLGAHAGTPGSGRFNLTPIDSSFRVIMVGR